MERVVAQEKDRGVVIDTGDEETAQCQAAVGKENRVLGCIRRGINSKSKEVLYTLNSNLVRAHMEYCVQFCSLHLRNDIVVIEKVQRRATKFILA